MWDQSVGMVGFLVKALVLLWAPSVVQCKESACNVGDPGLIPGSGWSPEREHGNPLQYSCSENHMDRGAWQATVQRTGKSQTQLKWLSMHTHTSWSTESCILTYERQTDKELSWSLLISALTYSWGFYPHDLITSQRHACMLSHFSCVRLFVTPMDHSQQAPPSVGFSRQEYWSGLPFPPPGDLPDLGIKPVFSYISCIDRWVLYH